MPGRQRESLMAGLLHTYPNFVDCPVASSIYPTTTTSPAKYLLAPSPCYYGTFIPATQSNASRQLVLGQMPDSSFIAQTSDSITVPQEMDPDSAQESHLYSSTSRPSCDETYTLITALDDKVERSSTRQTQTRTKSQQTMEAVQGTWDSGALLNTSKNARRQQRSKYVLPEDPRKRRVVELNRIAAAKCRLRKRNEISALISKAKLLQDNNRYLSTCVESLTAKAYALKTQLLQHTHCNCALIHRYITIEAKKAYYDLSSHLAAVESNKESTSVYHQSRSNSDISFSSSPDILTPGFETMPPPWAEAFQVDFASSERGEGVHGGMTGPYYAELLPMHSQPMTNMSLHLDRANISVDVVPRPSDLDGTRWRSSEELFLTDTDTVLPMYESPSITPEIA